METINIPPKWRGVSKIIVLGIEAGTVTARKIAIEELNHMADVADYAIELREAAAGGLMDLEAMVAAADRGEKWVVNAGARARLEALRAAVAKAGDK